MRVTIAEIQRRVAQEYSMPAAFMREPSPRGRRRINTHNVSHPRQAAMALSAQLTRHSKTRIGHFFGGRDRATVYHAIRVVAERRASDAKLDGVMTRVALEMVQG